MRRALRAHELDNPRLPRKTSVELTPLVSVPQTEIDEERRKRSKQAKRGSEYKEKKRAKPKKNNNDGEGPKWNGTTHRRAGRL